ncbi:hypothetical protein QYF36_016053 [Acer negundo]|nr:hypothetical protein QYF36_016053 [Acer negundo]
MEIGEACKTWGFFQVINHGVPLELLSRIKKKSKEFFDLPMEEKKLAKRDEVNPMGYYDSEHTKNVRDWKEVFDFMAKDPTFVPASHEPDETQLRTIRNQWPAHPINLGDATQVWSNERYASAEHRVVVNSEKERFSIPFFFFFPVHYVMLKPLEELVNEQNPARYREFNWGKFFVYRNRSDFKKREVENVQIYHFKIL